LSTFFRGTRDEGRCEVVMWDLDERPVPLPMRNDIRNHSPDGPNWGYGGSGPAQLALALLCQVVDRYLAEVLYQWFKAEVVAGWTGDSWFITRGQIQQWVDRHLADHPQRAMLAKEREETDQWLATLGENSSPGPTQTGTN